MAAESFIYRSVPSPLGDVGILAVIQSNDPVIVRIWLPMNRAEMETSTRIHYLQAIPDVAFLLAPLAGLMERYFTGEDVDFTPIRLRLDLCSPFQQRVLDMNRRVPMGKVTTYGRIATALSIPGGARAVGGALAANPFPIAIPCHRVIRSDGNLGGFGGGSAMKKALLEMEGVVIENTNDVAPRFMID